MTLNNETLRRELNSDHFRSFFPLYVHSFGDPDGIEGSAFDLYAAAKRNLEKGVAVPDIDIVCGSEEFIRDRVEDDVRLLCEMGYPVRYICPEGFKHDFSLWDAYLAKTFDELLPLKRAPIY